MRVFSLFTSAESTHLGVFGVNWVGIWVGDSKGQTITPTKWAKDEAAIATRPPLTVTSRNPAGAGALVILVDALHPGTDLRRNDVKLNNKSKGAMLSPAVRRRMRQIRHVDHEDVKSEAGYC